MQCSCHNRQMSEFWRVNCVHYSDRTYLLESIFLNHSENQWQNELIYNIIFTYIGETNLIGKAKPDSPVILYIYRAELMAWGFVGFCAYLSKKSWQECQNKSTLFSFPSSLKLHVILHWKNQQHEDPLINYQMSGKAAAFMLSSTSLGGKLKTLYPSCHLVNRDWCI